MKITSLWVVTRPTKNSTIGDICFLAETPTSLYRQFAGGLTPEEIVAFYDNQEEAEEAARLELHAVQNRAK